MCREPDQIWGDSVRTHAITPNLGIYHGNSQRASKVYQLIAAYGRKVRADKKSGKLIETKKTEHPPHFHPTRPLFHSSSSLPELSCHVQTDQSLDPQGQTEALDLPGLGIIIQAEKLIEALDHRK